MKYSITKTEAFCYEGYWTDYYKDGTMIGFKSPDGEVTYYGAPAYKGHYNEVTLTQAYRILRKYFLTWPWCFLPGWFQRLITTTSNNAVAIIRHDGRYNIYEEDQGGKPPFSFSVKCIFIHTMNIYPNLDVRKKLCTI